MLKILSWIYEESEIYLDRKKQKYVEIKGYMEAYEKEKCKV